MPEPHGANTDLPDTVSREAHQRMTDERNDLKAQVDTLGSQITNMTYLDTARTHFAAKGVNDPDGAAKLALPNMLYDKTEIGDIGTYLDDTFARLFPAPDTAPTTETSGDGIPTPDAAQPPGFARPSPAHEGAAPSTDKISTRSDEFKALVAAGKRDEIEALDKAGRISWLATTPDRVPG